MTSAGFRIDVHHHFAPPDYIVALGAEHAPHAPMARWTLAQSLEEMDRSEVATAVLSITIPGVWFGDARAARRLARTCNEHAAALVRDRPGRFGWFATVPLPDVDGTLAEIAHALDELGADGIATFTSYGDSWLGDPAFSPVLEELDRRGAVVYTHPISKECFRNLVPDVSESTIEYGTDTARTIASLVFSGSAARFRRIRWIFSHAGGTMPFLVGRFLNLARKPQLAERLPDGLLPELQRFFYDTAQAANPYAMATLKRLVPTAQILFGTDFPYATVGDHIVGLRACGFDEEELRAIERDNALRLLPTLGS